MDKENGVSLWVRKKVVDKLISDKDLQAINLYALQRYGRTFIGACKKKCLTKYKAEMILKRAKRKKNRKECRLYYCFKCKAFHVTSKEM